MQMPQTMANLLSISQVPAHPGNMSAHFGSEGNQDNNGLGRTEKQVIDNDCDGARAAARSGRTPSQERGKNTSPGPCSSTDGLRSSVTGREHAGTLGTPPQPALDRTEDRLSGQTGTN